MGATHFEGKVNLDILCGSIATFLLRCTEGPRQGEYDLWGFVCQVLITYWNVPDVDGEIVASIQTVIMRELRSFLPRQIVDPSGFLTESMSWLVVITLRRESSPPSNLQKIIDQLSQNRYCFFSAEYIWTVPPLRVKSFTAIPVLTLQEKRIVDDYRSAWAAVLRQIHRKLAWRDRMF